VFLDNDTRMLFATAYDGDWDAYIDDFATKIPDFLDIIDAGRESWPPARQPRICSAVIGSTVRPAPRPPLRCRVGSANVRPRRFANRNSERSAMMAM